MPVPPTHQLKKGRGHKPAMEPYGPFPRDPQAGGQRQYSALPGWAWGTQASLPNGQATLSPRSPVWVPQSCLTSLINRP